MPALSAKLVLLDDHDDDDDDDEFEDMVVSDLGMYTHIYKFEPPTVSHKSRACSYHAPIAVLALTHIAITRVSSSDWPSHTCSYSEELKLVTFTVLFS